MQALIIEKVTLAKAIKGQVNTLSIESPTGRVSEKTDNPLNITVYFTGKLNKDNTVGKATKLAYVNNKEDADALGAEHTNVINLKYDGSKIYWNKADLTPHEIKSIDMVKGAQKLNRLLSGQKIIGSLRYTLKSLISAYVSKLPKDYRESAADAIANITLEYTNQMLNVKDDDATDEPDFFTVG